MPQTALLYCPPTEETLGLDGPTETVLEACNSRAAFLTAPTHKKGPRRNEACSNDFTFQGAIRTEKNRPRYPAVKSGTVTHTTDQSLIGAALAQSSKLDWRSYLGWQTNNRTAICGETRMSYD